ncbi:MAG: hypothetical protein ACRD5W_02700 [Candidatus Acidiferrales bacterium]
MRLVKTVVSGCGALLLGCTLAAWAQGGPQEPAQKAPDDQVADSSGAARRGRRDPFEALVRKGTAGQAGSSRIRPAGVAGVDVATMRLDGVVRSASGMIAVISTPQNRVYFVREGERLFDGVVERISLDGMVVRERGQDAFGKPVDRLVTKRLYPSAGEGQ